MSRKTPKAEFAWGIYADGKLRRDKSMESIRGQHFWRYTLSLGVLFPPSMP